MIHQYKLNGYNIVLDTYSGSVHVVDDLAYEIIADYEKTSADKIVTTLLDKYKDDSSISESDIRETIADIEELKNDGQLFTKDEYENLSLDLKKRKTYVKALCLNVAHTCNLSCDYCFASQGKYNGNRAIMSYEVGQRAIDYLLENSGHHRNLDIDFFGGEPLMAWKVVKQIVAYARSKEQEYKKKFRFTFTTNGMLLNDEVTEFLNQEMYNVVLNLDGRKEVHDRLRERVNGKGSYEHILPKFRNLWDGITQPELQCQFKESNCYSKPECKDCWAKLYCSGGCPANALHATGSLVGTYDFSCDIFRKRVECSMMVKVDESIRAMEGQSS